MNMPSVIPLFGDLHEVQTRTAKALVAQFEAGYTCGKREAWVHMGLLGMCCFIGGGVFVAAWEWLVVRALS